MSGPTLEPYEDGLRVVWPEHTYRFLLSDGRTVDVRTARDDSDVRGLIVAETGASIEGVARLDDQLQLIPGGK